jgi:hypothetical protein
MGEQSVAKTAAVQAIAGRLHSLGGVGQPPVFLVPMAEVTDAAAFQEQRPAPTLAGLGAAAACPSCSTDSRSTQYWTREVLAEVLKRLLEQADRPALRRPSAE